MHGRILVYSNADEPLFELSPDEIFDCSRTEELNGKHTLTITTTHVLDYGYRILMKDDTGKWREHVVTSIDERHSSGLRALGTYGCIWSIQYDLSGVICDTMPGTQTQGGVPAATALQSLLSNTSRWGVGTVTVATSAGASFYGLQAWEALGVFCKTWGGEIDADITVDSSGVVSRNVQALSHVGSSEVVRRFDYGNDITEIGRRVSSAMYYARIIPLGKGEQIRDASGNPTGGYGRRITIESVNNNIKYLENSETAQILRTPDGSGGWEYPTRTVINDSITTPDALLAWGNSVLEQYTVPQVTYIANVVQLARAGMDVHGVELGDNCVCVDKKFSDDGLRISGRISRLVVNELAPSLETDVTIGDVGITMADAFKTLGNKITGVEDNLNATAATTADYLEHLLDNLNSEINATGGYTYITAGQGIRTYDREVTDPLVGAEATQVTEIKGGTIRFANSKTAQGEWEWKTVIVSGHIAAEMVTAANLTTGYIGSSSGGNYWNLDTGELRMASTAQFGDTTVAGALAGITSAQNAANDDNLIPFTGRMDRLYGWMKGPGWLSGKENSYIEAYSDTLDWNHRIVSPEIPLADLWGRELTFAVDGKSASADATVHIDVSIYHAGQSSRWAWYTPGDFTFGSGSYSRPSKTFTIGPNTAWSYPSGSTDRTFVTGTDKARVVLSLRTLGQRVNLNRWMLQPGGTATAWRPSAMDAASSVDDENLLPYTENVDEAHGWRPRNATLNGVTGMTIAANTSGTLDWSHGVDAPMIPLSVIWGKQVTFSGFFKSTVENTSVLAYVELWRPGASARHAWRQIGTINPSATSMTRYSCTIIPDADTPWSYTSQSDTTIDWQKDKARFLVVVSTLNATVTSNRWKLQYGYHTTDWMPSSSDASATTALNTLTQEDVFNRLTNNGTVQGIYLQNGKLYVNASYIQTGTLSANLIKGGKLQSNDGFSYFDLANNIIRLGPDATYGTTIEASGQIKAKNSNGTYFGTVSAPYNTTSNASGVIGENVYLTQNGRVVGTLQATYSSFNLSGKTYTVPMFEIKLLKRTVSKTIDEFYALSAAQKFYLFSTDNNYAFDCYFSSSGIRIYSKEFNWSIIMQTDYFKIETSGWLWSISKSSGATFTRK